MTSGIPAPILTSAPNFRDIGGYCAQAGGTVRRKRIFRSQLIANPTETDLATLQSINIRYICDLRGTHEREAAPDRWVKQPPPTLRHLDIGMDVRAGSNELLAIITADPTAGGVRTMMMHTYSLLPRAFEGRLGLLLDDIIAGDQFPAMVHCTAGKDRTGFVTAVLLLTLGVPIDVVHYDYALTEKLSDMDRMMTASAAYLKGIVGDRVAPDHEMLRMLCGTSPDYLDAALAAIRRDYGSVDNYLEKTAGFDAVKRDKLHELLLE
jgi:protein-tyrosine phosphatase